MGHAGPVPASASRFDFHRKLVDRAARLRATASLRFAPSEATESALSLHRPPHIGAPPAHSRAALKDDTPPPRLVARFPPA
jgi:hypothetical protein